MCPYDLHVHLSDSTSKVENAATLTRAQKLGFTGIAIESPASLTTNLAPKGLALFHRTTLSPRSAARLRHQVEKQKAQVDFLVVHGRTKPIWLSAAELANVDMVLTKTAEDFSVVDSQIARAMTKHNKPVEICLHDLLALKGAARSRLMRAMGQAMEHFLRAKSPLILTSGAQTSWQLRTPHDLAALAYLANIPEVPALKASLEAPNAFVARRKH